MDIIKLAESHKDRWQDKDESYWLARLVEEVGELGAALAHDHEHTPDVELYQIGSICINWLRKFYGN